jgi:glycosyltransferase involved in cell wall biosynthesis
LAPKRKTSADSRLNSFGPYRIAVLVPCFNEEAAIGKVVKDFRAALPAAAIFVFDNNSTDKTAEIARAAGAEVFEEKHRGKGFVVRRMFADVDADIYVLVDGDATYDAPSARRMIERLIDGQLDMVVGIRVDKDKIAYRTGHRAGNRILSGFVAWVFGPSFNDMLSGYRVFSRRPDCSPCFHRPCGPDRHYVSRDWAGAAIADRGALDRTHAAGIPVCRDRPCAGHRDARQTGDETARLPLPIRTPKPFARLNFFRARRLVMITIT